MLYMAIVVNQKSHQAGILYLKSKHSPVLGVDCTSKTLSKQAVTESKNCGEKTPASSLWVEINSDSVCTSSTWDTGGDWSWQEKRLAEKEAAAALGTWTPKSFFTCFFWLVPHSHKYVYDFYLAHNLLRVIILIYWGIPNLKSKFPKNRQVFLTLVIISFISKL